jgi:hypothetical protein
MKDPICEAERDAKDEHGTDDSWVEEDGREFHCVHKGDMNGHH